MARDDPNTLKTQHLSSSLKDYCTTRSGSTLHWEPPRSCSKCKSRQATSSNSNQQAMRDEVPQLERQHEPHCHSFEDGVCLNEQRVED
mmetsp:Transcript_22762/g.37697  ORF Transcript_22762/g.37697 Transcript_22762/m.37697 type:complete len:88 (+) Transcript_22762:197-460(+)